MKTDVDDDVDNDYDDRIVFCKANITAQSVWRSSPQKKTQLS